MGKKKQKGAQKSDLPVETVQVADETSVTADNAKIADPQIE
jgi:hypothetical protein